MQAQCTNPSRSFRQWTHLSSSTKQGCLLQVTNCLSILTVFLCIYRSANPSSVYQYVALHWPITKNPWCFAACLNSPDFGVLQEYALKRSVILTTGQMRLTNGSIEQCEATLTDSQEGQFTAARCNLSPWPITSPHDFTHIRQPDIDSLYDNAIIDRIHTQWPGAKSHWLLRAQSDNQWLLHHNGIQMGADAQFPIGRQHFTFSQQYCVQALVLLSCCHTQHTFHFFTAILRPGTGPFVMLSHTTHISLFHSNTASRHWSFCHAVTHNTHFTFSQQYCVQALVLLSCCHTQHTFHFFTAILRPGTGPFVMLSHTTHTGQSVCLQRYILYCSWRSLFADLLLL